MGRPDTLNALCALLRGEGAAPGDWMPLVAMANHASLTPALLGPLERLEAKGQAPADLMVFVRDVAARNALRNERLIGALGDAAVALNRAGITPVLFKGGALVAQQATWKHARILADMDLLVRPEEVEPAIAVLTAAGFGVVERYPGADVHCVAELGRPEDPGLIDLHQRPAGPPAAAEIPDLHRHCTTLMVGEGSVLVPSPAVLIFLSVLHDQLHDGDFWRGAFDLRHLMDFAELCRRGPDFDHLDALCRTELIRRAAYLELMAAHRLFGAPIPGRIANDRAARFHFRRSLAQHTHPWLVWPLGLWTMLIEAPRILAHRRFDREGRAQVLTANVHDGPRGGRIARFFYLFNTVRSGKV